MSWLLTLLLIRFDSVSTNTIPDFATQAECEQVGTAWAATIRRRENNTDLPVFRCELKAN